MEPADACAGTLVLGRYRLVRRIAVGGMGNIYLARSEGAAGFVRPVVIKQIRSELLDDTSAVRMFEREARINARISHPHIVSVLEFQRERGAYVMVMEYVPGLALSAWLRFHRRAERSVATAVAVEVTEQVLTALSAVHGLIGPDGAPTPVIHRDITPSNVLLHREGHVKLTDFGIARLQQHEPDEYETKTHSIKGKVAYLSPEVLTGEAPTPASDIFATGVMFHEMLVGRNEFAAGEVAATLTRILNHELTPPSALRADVGSDVTEVISKATAKEPDERYPSVDAFRAALRAVRTVPPEAAAAQLKDQLRTDLGHPDLEILLGDLHPTRLDETWRTYEASLDLGPTVASVDLSPPGEPGSGLTSFELELDEPDETGADAEPSTERPPMEPMEESGLELDLDRVAPEPQPEPQPEAPRRRPWVAVSIAVAIAAGGGAFWFFRPPNVAMPTEVRRLLESTAESFPSVSPAPDVGPRTAAFRAREPELRRCFETAEGRPRAPVIQFHYAVEPSGRVRTVQVAPGDVADSELGRCLAEVARKVRFPRADSMQLFTEGLKTF